MTAPELLPCPFCGGPARAWGAQRLEADGSCLESIGCGNMDCAFEPATDYLQWDEAVAAWNRRTPYPEVAALIAEARREWCKKMDRIADEIDEQVKVTRAYVGDCGMDHNQKELMKICTSHFLDKAATIRALKETTHD